MLLPFNKKKGARENATKNMTKERSKKFPPSIKEVTQNMRKNALNKRKKGC